jgi:hypothetical protein
VSQRSLARELGIALGLSNLLIRRMIRKGWIRLVRIHPNRVRYLITPAGIAEKARMSQAYFAGSLKFYIETRDRIRENFAVLSAECAAACEHEKRIVFFGAGEVAEIGYVCLQDSDLSLVAVVDEGRMKPFFGLPVRSPNRLNGMTINGNPYDRVVVMSLDDTDGIRSKLQSLGVPPNRVFWLYEASHAPSNNVVESKPAVSSSLEDSIAD